MGKDDILSAFELSKQSDAYTAQPQGIASLGGSLKATISSFNDYIFSGLS